MWQSADDFKQSHFEAFLNGYRRDLMQSQPLALETWIEKDALSEICDRVAREYRIPVILARGFSSISFLNDCRDRANAASQPTKILYLGDLDPSGYEMLPSMLHTLQNEMHLGDTISGERLSRRASWRQFPRPGQS